METNTELDLAWRFIENTGTHLFLTGKAGTGKTTFLRNLRERLPKRMVVLAPTGIAAINAGGVTIHSFFQLPLAPYIPNASFNTSQVFYRFSKEKRRIIRSMDLLVIDEISMVRADLLDAVDSVLRRYRDWDKPFGGVQLLMIGDVQQLAPVVKDEEWDMLKQYYDTPYFFGSKALQQTHYETIELKVVYRQQDLRFLELLNKVRENKIDQVALNDLNTRYIPDFVPPKDEGYIRLTTHNWQAQRVNERELDLLGGTSYSFKAEVSGIFPEYSYPTDEVLTLKSGAQIMFVKNDTVEHRFYNGMIGEVVKVGSDSIWVRSKDDNNVFSLERTEWSNSKYVINKETLEITEEVEGTFSQYPIRLAWAITIHKSQGLTFEHAILDTYHSFAHGQTYVALSRCKTLNGMVLVSPLRQEAIISDDTVDRFNQTTLNRMPDAAKLKSLEDAYTLQIMHEVFDMLEIEQTFNIFVRLIDEHLYKKYPELLVEYKNWNKKISSLRDVQRRFEIQYTLMLKDKGGYLQDPVIQQRIKVASNYFFEQLSPLYTLQEKVDLKSDNKEIVRQIKEKKQALDDALRLKLKVMQYNTHHLFELNDYLRKKAVFSLETTLDGEDKGKKKKEKKEKSPKIRTGQKTYELYISGHTINQIAEERGLAVSTVESHLSEYIANGQLNLEAVVSAEVIEEIKLYMRVHPEEESLSIIKQNVAKTISYGEIKMVLAAFRPNLARNSSN